MYRKASSFFDNEMKVELTSLSASSFFLHVSQGVPCLRALQLALLFYKHEGFTPK